MTPGHNFQRRLVYNLEDVKFLSVDNSGMRTPIAFDRLIPTWKLLKQASRTPAPLDRSVTRKARAAITATMTAVLAKVGRKAAAQVRARLKALGKAGYSDDEPRDAQGRWTAYAVSNTDSEGKTLFHAFASRQEAETFAASRRARNRGLDNNDVVATHALSVQGAPSDTIHIVHSPRSDFTSTAVLSAHSDSRAAAAAQLSQLKQEWGRNGPERDEYTYAESVKIENAWNAAHPDDKVDLDDPNYRWSPEFSAFAEQMIPLTEKEQFPGVAEANEYFDSRTQRGEESPARYVARAKISPNKQMETGALRKAEESPEDISDGVDFSDFEEIVPDIGDALAGVATDSARQTLVHIGVSDRADLMNQVNEGAVDAAHARAAEMVGMRRLADGSLAPSRNAKNTITETTRDAIRSIIADGLADNIGSDAIAQNIEDATAFSPERAELIAHTEVGNINSAASLDSAQAAADAGVEVLKGWLTAGDDRVEDICKGNADAGFIPLDDDFPSGDAAPLAHPRCRCSVSYRVKESTDND